MKAGIYLGKEQVVIEQFPLPEVGDNDVLVQNLYSSICGTDVAVFTHGPNTGHRVNVGGEFGHEMVSRVVKVGKNITDLKVGERVYPYPRYAKDDTSRAGTIGGFSEYILIPNAKKEHSLYPVDERISDKLASLIEPFTVGCRAARRGMLPGSCGGGRISVLWHGEGHGVRPLSFPLATGRAAGLCHAEPPNRRSCAKDKAVFWHSPLAWR